AVTDGSVRHDRRKTRIFQRPVWLSCMYIPTKPNIYGIKIFALSDAKMFYTANMEVYVGQQPDGPFRVSNRPTAVVQRLSKYKLPDPLLKRHKLTVIGTLRKKNVYYLQNVYKQQRTLVSYIPRLKQNVLLLSTLHHDDSINMETGKPEIIMACSSRKGVVNVVDKLCASYNTAQPTR
ncbi:hypothetical protein HUJ04_011072, partial [Dendroctonus ponderosae]